MLNLNKLTNKQIEGYYEKCLEFANEIINPDLKECCLKIYQDYKKELLAKPAVGDPYHHFFNGGLIYHLYSVTRNAKMITELYDYIDIDKDLVIFGALLHDIGKIYDYQDFEDIEEGTSGILGSSAYMVGHCYEGCHLVENYLEKYNLEERFKYQVLHMIGSHMGSFGEFGILTSPKMLEVVIINFAEHIDSKIDRARNNCNKAQKGELYYTEKETEKYYKSANPYFKK